MLDRIKSEIARHGPLPFDHFMALALYDANGGYFVASSTLRSSEQGDFLTSPEVSPFFGATIARFVEAEAERIGPLTLIEAGAGSGSLLRALLDALPDTPAAIYAVEVAAAATARLSISVPEAVVVADLDAVPRTATAVLIANELIDNLPAAVAVRRAHSWTEQSVDVDDGALVTLEGPARPEVAAWADAFAGPVAEGDQVEVQIAAGEWITSALGRFDSGAVVVVDYGETAAGLEHRRSQGTVRTYRSHHLGPDPLLFPGETDITMDVNFTALIAAAESAGATVTLDRQDDFLTRWGLRDVLSNVRNRELAAARTGETMERLIFRSQITGAEALLHPRGLGDFRVLVAKK